MATKKPYLPPPFPGTVSPETWDDPGLPTSNTPTAPWPESLEQEEFPDPLTESPRAWKNKVQKLPLPPDPVTLSNPGGNPLPFPQESMQSNYRAYELAFSALQAYQESIKGEKRTPEMKKRLEELGSALEKATEALLGEGSYVRHKDIEDRFGNPDKPFVDKPEKTFTPTLMPPEPDTRYSSPKDLGVVPNGQLSSELGIKNILAVYAASEGHGNREYGEKWYGIAHSDAKRLGEMYPHNSQPIPLDVVAGVIAATSPNTKWSSNLFAAQQILRGYGKKVIEAAEERDYEEAENALAAIFPNIYSTPVSIGGGIYTKNVKKAQAILDAWINYGRRVPELGRGKKYGSPQEAGREFLHFFSPEEALQRATELLQSGCTLRQGKLTHAKNEPVGKKRKTKSEEKVKPVKLFSQDGRPLKRPITAMGAEILLQLPPERGIRIAQYEDTLPPKPLSVLQKEMAQGEKLAPPPVKLTVEALKIGKGVWGFWAISPLMGQKVNSFYENIRNVPTADAAKMVEDAEKANDPARLEEAKQIYEKSKKSEQNPTIDGHAFNIWRGAAEALNLKGVSVPQRLYRTIQQDYIQAGAKVGLTGQAMQAITWCTWRNMLSKFFGKDLPDAEADSEETTEDDDAEIDTEDKSPDDIFIKEAADVLFLSYRKEGSVRVAGLWNKEYIELPIRDYPISNSLPNSLVAKQTFHRQAGRRIALRLQEVVNDQRVIHVGSVRSKVADVKLHRIGWKSYECEVGGKKCRIKAVDLPIHGSFPANQRQRRQSSWAVSVEGENIGYAKTLTEARQMLASFTKTAYHLSIPKGNVRMETARAGDRVRLKTAVTIDNKRRVEAGELCEILDIRTSSLTLRGMGQEGLSRKEMEFQVRPEAVMLLQSKFAQDPK